MSSRQQDGLSEAIGTDAFLDIVANLVGILLILLMVIGVRMEDASKSVHASTTQSDAPVQVEPVELPEIPIPDVGQAQLELDRLKQSIREADGEAQRLARLARLQKLDRDNLMVAISKAELALNDRRDALDETQRQGVALELELQQQKDEYQTILRKLESAKRLSAEPNTEVLPHIATPLAKTVFVREEHFRLLGGRLLYVPLTEMTDQLRREAPKKMWKLETARQTTESIGPQDGFEMRYTLRRNRIPVKTESGLAAVREVIELDRFVMVPVGDAKGETIEEALQPTSAFRSRLAGWSARDTIITIWTYSDSFAAFRKLKGELYKLGYLTAARPLPDNQMISGSPQGTRSAAQ